MSSACRIRKASNMIKLLCTLFLAGFVFQANAVRVSTEPPYPDHDAESFDLIPSILNPFELISNIASLLNPFTLVSKITSFLNPLNWIPDISTLLNPIEMMKKFVNLFNPFSWIPDFLNPFHYFPNLNPLNWIPDSLKFNPLDIFGKNKCTLKPESGPCKAKMQRFYYDEHTKSCLMFVYGGCKGNRNNFEQKEECEKACRGH
ncbi:unnamed protein product [Larinioides sclopetarius]|uniref:BPTI/Kunitz inhibitor domain-containing protein n=1 Tax=Larinioides sclopetarius TaxID=280406 RepID=A0AAV1ZSJ1_9ARAC